MRKLFIDEKSFTQVANITNPPNFSRFAYFQVPKNTFYYIPAYQPVFFRPAIVESFTSDGTTTDFTLTFTPVDPAMMEAYHWDGSTLTKLTDFTVNGKVVTFATAPASGTVDIYYFATNVSASVVVEVSFGVNEKKYVLEGSDIGKLALISQLKKGEEFYFQKDIYLIQDMKFGLYTKASVRLAIENIRDESPLEYAGIKIEALASSLDDPEVFDMFKGQPMRGVYSYYEIGM